MKTNTLYVLYILWLRQVKRYFRSKSRIVGSLVQPILFLVALGFGLSSTFSQAGKGDYIEFLAPGIIAMSILFTAIFSGIEIIWDRQFGFLKEVLVAPISRFTTMLGRTLGGATTSSFQGVLVLAISFFLGFRIPLVAIIPGIIFMILISIVFTALGTAVASAFEDMQGFQLIMNFVVMPVFFLSGALFPLTSAPLALRIVAYLNPLFYGVDGMRSVFGIQSVLNGWTDGLIMVGISILFISFGAWMFNRIKA